MPRASADRPAHGTARYQGMLNVLQLAANVENWSGSGQGKKK